MYLFVLYFGIIIVIISMSGTKDITINNIYYCIDASITCY